MVRVTSTQTFHNSKVMQCLRIMFVYIFRGEKLNSTCYNMNLNRNSLCRLRVGSQNQPLVCPTRCGQCKDVCIQISTAVCSVSGGSEESGDSALPPQDRSGRWSSIDGTLIGLTSSYILWDTKPAADHTLKGGAVAQSSTSADLVISRSPGSGVGECYSAVRQLVTPQLMRAHGSHLQSDCQEFKHLTRRRWFNSSPLASFSPRFS